MLTRVVVFHIVRGGRRRDNNIYTIYLTRRTCSRYNIMYTYLKYYAQRDVAAAELRLACSTTTAHAEMASTRPTRGDYLI